MENIEIRRELIDDGLCHRFKVLFIKMKLYLKRKSLLTYISIIVLILSLILAPYILYLKNSQDNSSNSNIVNIEDEEKNESQILKNDLIHQNDLKYKLMEILDLSRLIDTISDKNLRSIIYKWKNDNFPFLGIERFAIPVLSTISSGKSSLLNYIANTNYLQVRENVTTKFCIMIRHKKGYKKGKIYNVIIEKRADINKYNFHKGEEIVDDIKTFIEERNKLIEQYQENNMEIKDASLYFIIMEIDTGLFEGEYEKYSQLIEFIDIPGLNENGIKNNFYFKNVLPFIKMNFLFPIIIIDSTKFASEDSSNTFHAIFEAYISEYIRTNLYDTTIQKDIDNQNYILKKIKKECLFIINKLNLHPERERKEVIEKIIKDTSSEFNVDINLNKTCFIINAKAKNLEVNKYNSLIDYTNYTLNQKNLKRNEVIIDILADSFKQDFNFSLPDNIEEISKKSKKADKYKIFKDLVIEHDILLREFQESYYNYFNEIFLINKKLTQKMDLDGILIKNAIKGKIKELIDRFLNNKEFNSILKYLNISEEKLNEDFSQYIVIKDPFTFLNTINEPIKELNKIGSDNEGIKKLNNEYDDLTKFIQKNKYIHYILSGVYSSGKTFTLNNIIGHNLYLLYTGGQETTSHAFIIRNNKEINLYEATLENSKYGYYFNKTKKLASGKENVTKQIEYVNRQIKNFSYYIVETPIEMYANLSIPKEILDSIEIIDYPGSKTKKTKNLKFDKNSLFRKDIINGFFFVSNPKDNKMNDVKEVFKEVITQFVYKDSNVEDMMNCLILFTKNDKNKMTDFYNFDINTQALKLFEDLKKDMDMSDIERIKIKLNESSINFAKFSNYDYLEYIKFNHRFKTFQTFIQDIIGNNAKITKKKDFKRLFELIDKSINEIYQKKIKEPSFFSKITRFIKPTKNKGNEKNKVTYNDSDLYQFINEFKNELVYKGFIDNEYDFKNSEKTQIKKYFEKYFYFKNNLDNENYEKSFFEDFIKKLDKFMSYSKDIIYRDINIYLNDILTKLKGVMKTIKEKLALNPNEFEKKFSFENKRKLLEDIEKSHNKTMKRNNKEIKEMKNRIYSIQRDLDCSQKDPDEFERQFNSIKNLINNELSKTNKKCEEFYNYFMTNIEDFEDDYITEEYESKKKEKKSAEEKNMELIYKLIKTQFENKKDFLRRTYDAFLGSIFGHYDYKEDIKNACNNYEEELKLSINSFESNVKEKFDRLKQKGIEDIEIIFDTAHSSFNEIKKNLEIFNKVEKYLNNLLKNNNINKNNY